MRMILVVVVRMTMEVTKHTSWNQLQNKTVTPPSQSPSDADKVMENETCVLYIMVLTLLQNIGWPRPRSHSLLGERVWLYQEGRSGMFNVLSQNTLWVDESPVCRAYQGRVRSCHSRPDLCSLVQQWHYQQSQAISTPATLCHGILSLWDQGLQGDIPKASWNW